MDRNREPRKSTLAASANALSRRRHRSSSFRDSPEEEGPIELQETARLRDRGLKKDRDRDWSSRNKRRRGDTLDGGEESSEESMNDEEEDDYDDMRGGAGGTVRMFPPPNPMASVSSSLLSNHHYLDRKSFPSSATAKVLRPAVPGWKPADEVIGFTVPRKARSASGKRSQECSISGSGLVAEHINRQTSTSPVRLTPSLSPVSPPSSSTASIRKKMKPNGPKPRPAKSTSKPFLNSEDIEIEIAEVLYGMMTQTHSSSMKESTVSDLANPDLRETSTKSRVSSPISNSVSQLRQNSSSSAAPLSAVAPKRKRPRQVSDDLGNLSVLHSPITRTVTKVEASLSPKEISSPNMVSAAENGSVPLDFSSYQVDQPPSEPPPPDSGRSESCCESVDMGLAKEDVVTSPKKDSPVVRPDNDLVTVIKADSAISANECQREDKFEIDLMALPPQMRSSPQREGEFNFGAALEQKLLIADKEDENALKSGKEEAINAFEQKKEKATGEEAESEKNPVVIKERDTCLQLDLEKHESDISASGNKLNPEVQKPQQQQQPEAVKDEVQPKEKIAQSGSLPLPLSLGWPGGLPPMGYMGPLHGVVSMDGKAVSTTPIQPQFSYPRPKRCATHCYIARNILYLHQIMKINPFWPPSAGSAASLFGDKHCNLNVLPSAELQGNNVGRTINSVQENGQGLAIFSGHSGKNKGTQGTNIPDAQKQQQISLQQALPPCAPSNVLHGPAFIFPLNQQQAAAAAAVSSIRPGSVKPPTTSGQVAFTSSSTSASMIVSTTAPPASTAVTFNYPNIPVSEAQQYLAILQNPYPFPIPSVGATPAYQGTPAQAIPFFNGSFYSSQMIHPSRLQQQQQLQPSQQQNTSTGSSSLQKHLHSQQQQQRQQGSSGNNLHNFPAPRMANQHMPNAEISGEDSPSTADSRLSRTSVGVYSQNFSAVPIHPQNFALMTPSPPSAFGGASSGSGNQGEKKHQQSLKSGLESVSPQTFAVSFGSMNGVDMSSMAQNHAVLQSLPEASRQSFQMMSAAVAAQGGQKKRNFRVSEEGNTALISASNSSNNVDSEKKSSVKPPTVGQQSVVFSRTDLPDSISAPSLRAPHSSTTNTLATANAPPNSQFQAQLQYQQHHQQMLHLHKQQQQQQQLAAAVASRNKTPPTSNVSVYSNDLASSAKFPNGISNFPQNLVQNSNSSSPTQSPQWRNCMKTTSQVPSTTSSLKNIPQQQTRTHHNQTQISFGGAPKPAAPPPPPQGQQVANSHRAPSPPMVVGSPTTSSISKGANGSPRTTTTSTSAGSKSAQPSTLSCQPSKNSASVGNRNISSVLSNSHVTSFSNTSAKTQLHQHQQQMLLSHAYMQAQVANQPFYLQRRHLEQPPQGSSAASSSTGMLSLCSSVIGSNANTSNAKALADSSATAAASNLKGGGLSSQGILHSAVPPGFSYVHAVPSPGQLKPTEQNKAAGNRDILTRR